MQIGEWRVERRVEFHETDRVGMVHFSNYFRYMDSAIAEFFRALDLSGPLSQYWCGTEPGEYDWPYASVSCDYKKSLRFDDVVEIHVWVKRIGTKSVTFGVSFKTGGAEVAIGQAVVVCAQALPASRPPLRFPRSSASASACRLGWNQSRARKQAVTTPTSAANSPHKPV